MHITTTARHCELDDRLRDAARLRLEKLGRFARDITEVHLVVTGEGERRRHVAEITLRLPGRDLVSREQADEPQVAVDLAADRLEQRMRRVKERRTIGRKGDRTRAADQLAAAPNGAPEGDDFELESALEHDSGEE